MNAAAVPTPVPSSARPRIVDLATLIVVAAAALNVYIGVLVGFTAASSGLPVAPGLVAVVVVISVVYAVAVAVLALLFRTGRPWARTVLISVAALALLTLFAPNALNLAVIVLLVAASVLLYRRPVNTWVRVLQGKRPA